jgi:hypothetical protein
MGKMKAKSVKLDRFIFNCIFITEYQQLPDGKDTRTCLYPHCKPGEAYTRLITATCEAGRGQRTCGYWRSVYGVYKSLRLLPDMSSITLYMASQSVICILNLGTN